MALSVRLFTRSVLAGGAHEGVATWKHGRQHLDAQKELGSQCHEQLGCQEFAGKASSLAEEDAQASGEAGLLGKFSERLPAELPDSWSRVSPCLDHGELPTGSRIELPQAPCHLVGQCSDRLQRQLRLALGQVVEPLGRLEQRVEGCEVLAVSNWLLSRDDQVGCTVFSPIDHLERRGR